MVLPRTSNLWLLPLNMFLLLSLIAEASPAHRRDHAHSASHNYYLVGDIRLQHSSSSTNSRHRTAVEGTQSLHRIAWPGGRVPYIMPNDDYPDWLQDLIKLAMAEVERQVSPPPTGHRHAQKRLPAACVTFTPRTSEPHFLSVRDEGSCHATIGYSSSASPDGGPVLSVSPSCARLGAIKHQLLHVLGFSHEHTRPDRDLYLRVNHTNVATPAEFLLDGEDQHLHDLSLPYDFESLLHFGPYTGAKDPRFPVITPRPEFAPGVKLGQANTLSPTDVLRVQRLYKCVEDTPSRLAHAPPAAPARHVLFECDFRHGPCGMMAQDDRGRGSHGDVDSAPSRDKDIAGKNTGDHGDSASRDGREDTDADQLQLLHWAVVSGLTPDGPAAGRTNGADPYLYVSPRLAGWARDGTITALHQPPQAQTRRDDTQRSQQLSEAALRHAGLNQDGLSAEVAALLSAAGDAGIPSARASVFTPHFSPTDLSGRFCVDFQLFQTDNRGGLTVILNTPRSQADEKEEEEEGEKEEGGEVIEQLEGIALDGWTWAGFTVQGYQGRRYTLEMRAAVGGGSVALDDLHVTDGECL